MTPDTECRARLEALRATVRSQALDGALLAHATDVFFIEVAPTGARGGERPARR